MRTALLLVAFVVMTALAGCEGQAKLPCADRDLQTGPSNCGSCGNVCPLPAHAAAACLAGVCDRADCDAGWADLEAEVFGCETAIASIPESGLVYAVPSSSTSLLQHGQTGPAHRNQAVLAEPTPAPVGGVVEQTGSAHRNQPGFNALLQ